MHKIRCRLWRLRQWFWYDLTEGVANLVRWAPIVWRDRDYDWHYLAAIMEYKLRRMADRADYGYHVGGKRDAKRQRVCAELLRRLQADEYDRDIHTSYKIAEHQGKADQAYLGHLLGKHLRAWWD